MLKEARPVPHNDRLDDFNRRPRHHEPAEEQHRRHCRRNGAHHCGDAERQQSDAKGQKPSPVPDEVVRKLDVQALCVRRRHAALPFSSEAISVVASLLRAPVKLSLVSSCAAPTIATMRHTVAKFGACASPNAAGAEVSVIKSLCGETISCGKPKAPLYFSFSEMQFAARCVWGRLVAHVIAFGGIV